MNQISMTNPQGSISDFFLKQNQINRSQRIAFQQRALGQNLSRRAGGLNRAFVENHNAVSALELFAACPFRFLVHRGLRAQEREIFEVDARQRGVFRLSRRFHVVLPGAPVRAAAVPSIRAA